jgi:hypothetical protein
VSPLYLYAIFGAAPARPLGTGLRDEPLRLVPCDDLVAVAGEVDAAPALTPAALRGHDAVVRRLAEITDAILPARFGAVAADAEDLRARLARAGDGLRDALARVAGREQMILRIYRASPERSRVTPSTEECPPSAEGPGARYLAERARAQRGAAAVEELAPIRPVLDRFVTAERVERHQTPPLVASVYHLLARGRAPAYAAAVERAARDLPALRITVSGPWAPYAFAPESLG